MLPLNVTVETSVVLVKFNVPSFIKLPARLNRFVAPALPPEVKELPVAIVILPPIFNVLVTFPSSPKTKMLDELSIRFLVVREDVLEAVLSVPPTLIVDPLFTVTSPDPGNAVTAIVSVAAAFVTVPSPTFKLELVPS